jgi:Polyglycine hydrolase-like, structural repeat
MNQLRLHIIPLTDEELDANGNPAYAFAVTPEEFAQLVERVNLSFEGTDIRVVFDPETDWWPVANTTLNSDAPSMRQLANEIAAAIPGKIVCFLRWGSDKNGPTGNGNAYPPPGAGPKPPHVDDVEQNYVALPNRIAPGFGLLNQGNGSFVAHELGHYLGLYHTFPGWTDRRGPVYGQIAGSETPSADDADQAVIDYVAAGDGTTNVLDGDGLSDTPPDPSPVLYQAHGQDVCVQGKITVSGTMKGAKVKFSFAPDPENVMSYFGGCAPTGSPPSPRRFSPQQIQTMNKTLDHSARRHLLEVPCPSDFHDVPVERLQNCFNYWVNRRLWPVTLTIARHDGAMFASGSFQRGQGRRVRHLMSADELRTEIELQRARFGRPQQRPHQVNVLNTSHGLRYTALWAPAAGEWVADVELDASTYEARWHERRNDDWVQVDLAVAGGTQLRFTSVWERRDYDDYASYWGMTAAAYQQRFDQMWPKAMRPVRFCRYVQPGAGERFAAIWERLPGRWAHYFGMDHSGYQKHWEDFALKRRLRLFQLHAYEQWFSPIWHDPGQSNWRWCRKCEGLAFGGQGVGVCPAGGGHDYSQSRDYTVPHNADGVGQENWRWCGKCQVLAFAGHGTGPCSAGGLHDHGGSGNYRVPLNWSGPGQDGWRWCKKCQGLAMNRSPQGRCPAGGRHNMDGSGSYRLPTIVWAYT